MSSPHHALSVNTPADADPLPVLSTDASTRLNGAQVRAQCISAGISTRYKSYLNGIGKWIKSNKNIQNPDRFFDAAGDLDPNYFTPMEFEEFLLAKQGELKTSTLSRYRSAMKDLYQRHNLPVPPEYGEAMKTLFSGLKRLEADQNQSGSSPQKSGKQPLTYSLYSRLCADTLARTGAGFAHLFLTTQWNLMRRSKSVETICTAHLSDGDDSIGCMLHKTKTNQEGSGSKDPRHIYANPLSPSICWVTALAIYLACNPCLRPGPLFPGSNKKIRFSKALGSAINESCEAKQFGTHSIRKGVASYACGGSTVGPSIVSVCLRCGWSLGGVQDRYFRYESAGDQYLGRIVAGLPVNKSDFAVLPPHFIEPNDPTVLEYVNQMFPSLRNELNLAAILKLCLASLVYHAEYLRRQLPKTHSLLSTYLFRKIATFKYLRDRVRTSDSPWLAYHPTSKCTNSRRIQKWLLTTCPPSYWTASANFWMRKESRLVMSRSLCWNTQSESYCQKLGWAKAPTHRLSSKILRLRNVVFTFGKISFTACLKTLNFRVPTH